MERCELTDSRRGHTIGERPLDLPLKIGRFHHFEGMTDPNKLKASGGIIKVEFTTVHEAGGSSPHVLQYSADVDGHMEYVQDGLRAMQWHNQEHEKKSELGIQASNEKVLPAAKSYEVSHQEIKPSSRR